MSIIYVLIPIAIVFIFVAIAIFIWAVKSNQFEDLERHGSSVLFDEQATHQEKTSPEKPDANS